MDGAADYVFLRELGRGPHGRVFLARAPARLEVDEPQVAVKVLLAAASDGGFEALVDELEAFAEVGSPRVVPVHDVAMDGGMMFYAMGDQLLRSIPVATREEP